MDVIRLKPLKGYKSYKVAVKSRNLCNDVTFLTIKRAIHSTAD